MTRRLSWVGLAISVCFVLLGCGGPAPDVDAGTRDSGQNDPCLTYSTCLECPDSECDWCAGSCRTRPDGFGVGDDEWCEWGLALHDGECTELGGVRPVESQLPIDCRNSRNAREPRCDDFDPTPQGTVGAGPLFPSGGTNFPLGGAFVDAASRTIYVAATTRLNGVEPPGNSRAALMAVDLDSGDRRLVSGTMDDARAGRVELGSGPEMGRLHDVKPDPAGGFIVLGSAGFFHVSDSGDRTLIHDADDLCIHAGFPWFWRNQEVTMAVGPDSTIYVALSGPSAATSDPPNPNDPRAIAAIDSTGCRIVSVAANDELYRVGTGPRPTGVFQNVLLDEGTLYANTEFGQIHQIDIDTGARLGISDISNDVGSGGEDGVRPGDQAFVRGPAGTLWLGSGESNLGTYGPIMFTEVELASGDASARYNLTDISLVSSSGVLRHPDGDSLAILILGEAIVVVEPGTGNANLLSY